MEVFYTILSGVTIYILGQIFNTFYIASVKKQKAVIGEIADALIFYANVYCNTIDTNEPQKEKRQEAHDLFRRLASQLMSKTHQVPNYTTLSRLRLVVDRQKITMAHSQLISLSNGMWPTKTEDLNANNECRTQLSQLLNLIVK